MLKIGLTATLLAALAAAPSRAADPPAPRQADVTLDNFRFHDGATLPQLRLHVTTLGEPSGEPVLVLHGTAGTGASMLTPAFAGQLFGPGQPLDAQRYFVILPDAVGAGGSSKPSDGLRAQFPHYDYEDMIEADYRLLTEGLHIRHLRLVIGNSMGGMETWRFAERYPDFMDAAVPMASQPTAMSARNWMMRRMIIDAVRTDPDWHDGNYTTQPQRLRWAVPFFNTATSGGTLAYAAQAPTREAADKLLQSAIDAPFAADANDFMYQWDASRNYDAAPDLERIKAHLLVINSADDERNPPETGLLDAALKHVRDAQYLLIPASPETRGHGTTSFAKFYAQPLRDFLASVPRGGT